VLNPIGPIHPLLISGEVHVWWFELDRNAVELDALARVLAEDERERVARFRFQRDADRALAARGLLRTLLGRYVGRPPGDLRFEYGEQSKPGLPGQPIHFNLSHSSGLGVCAITLDQPVGIDVERLRDDFDHAGIARQSFSAAERAVLATAFAAHTTRGFFQCWTLKEAYIKARGGGLSIPLDAFDVSLSDAIPAQAVVSREAIPAAHGWFTSRLAAGPDFAAAVAVRSPTWSVREWQLALA
jgi:4'-phosphopantetheinyl transferase